MADRDVATAGPATRLLQKVVEIRPDEVRAVFLAWGYFFFILCSYYVLRPIRDEMGVAGGVDNLPWLFTGTLLATLAAQPLFGALVARFPRKRFIPYTYRFFGLNVIGFWALLTFLPENVGVWTGRAFFIWVTVFNLFVVSVFWAFMADIFRNEQGKRLFGFIGIGGTLGAISGGAVTAALVGVVGQANLLLIAVVFLEIGVWCVHALGRLARDRKLEPEDARGEDEVIGGGVMAGVGHVLRSPYLLQICVYMLLFTVGSTFLYFQQADIVEGSAWSREERTAFFAQVDLAINVLTILTQASITGRMMKTLGVGITLAFLPAISVLGFLGLALMPAVAMVVGFQVVRRAGNFAVARPTREVLFTVVPREDKYKAKSFIDTFVYRGGDQVGAWSYALMGWMGLGVAGIAWVGVPLSALWLLSSLWLGRRQRELADARDGPPPGRATPEPALSR